MHRLIRSLANGPHALKPVCSYYTAVTVTNTRTAYWRHNYRKWDRISAMVSPVMTKVDSTCLQLYSMLPFPGSPAVNTHYYAVAFNVHCILYFKITTVSQQLMTYRTGSLFARQTIWYIGGLVFNVWRKVRPDWGKWVHDYDKVGFACEAMLSVQFESWI